MDTVKLNKLAELRLAEREIGEQIDALLPEINAMAADLESGTELEVDAGRFIVAKRRKWTYTAPTLEAEKKVKELKKTEEMTGDATYIENTSLTFKENDNEE